VAYYRAVTDTLLSAYVALIDREARLAQAIGLERRARRVPTLAEALNGVGEDR